MIADHKKKSLAAEYGDILDIRQPIPTTLCPETKGKPEEQQRAAVWNLLGGHDLLKQYAEQWVMEPMLLGDRRRTTRGFLLVGPAGTGKTWYGELLAAVCRINFVYVDFSKLYGGIVGETERNTERLYEAIEAMAPCIVFADEIDSAFSSGRQSAGDSGVQARVFNRTMRWLSDDARWGKVVVLAATNRPDLLDEAFIRAGRFDDVIPALPPHPSDAKGRKSLLAAVCKKTGVRVLKSLVETLKTPDNGLGRLIFSPRVWTGAEVERLVKMAFGNAAQRVSRAAKEQAAAKKLPRRETLEFLRTETKNPLIELDDWNHAMDSYRPNTRQAETQIDLALGYSNNDDYCPAEWRSRLDAAREKTANTVESAANYNGAAGAYERD
jgi:SpoVK/Ycf46/Vps4 family AAA+-type ATPase